MSVPGVVAMHAGPYGTASTFSPTGRVWGVRTTPDRIDVHLVAAPDHDLLALGRAVQDAVAASLGGYAGLVAVHIEDTGLPQTDEPARGRGATRVVRAEPSRRTP